MFWTDIITGALLMLTGLLVDRHPRMISGINTMSNERLAKVDLDGLKRGLRNVLLIAGATMLLLAILTYFVHIPEAFNMIALFAVTMAIVVSFVLISKRYDAGLQGEEGKKERRKNWIVLFIVLLVFAAVIPLFFIGTKPALIEVTEECIEAKSGMYKAAIPMSDITETNVLTDWPDFPIRTNGIASEDVGIGHFRKKGGESCMLFVCTDGGPLLEVRTADGKLYYLNCATEEETMEMIAKVKSVIRSRRTTGYNDIHTLCPHGGETSAISQARRRTLFAWEIAGQARNEGYGVRSVCQMKSKRM